MTEENKSLYERLGGVYSIGVVVDDFIDGPLLCTTWINRSTSSRCLRRNEQSSSRLWRVSSRKSALSMQGNNEQLEKPWRSESNSPSPSARWGRWEEPSVGASVVSSS